MPQDFTIVLRGYDRGHVDRVLGLAATALSTDDAGHRGTAREALRTARFPVVLRGYDRHEVDAAVAAALRQL